MQRLSLSLSITEIRYSNYTNRHKLQLQTTLQFSCLQGALFGYQIFRFSIVSKSFSFRFLCGNPTSIFKPLIRGFESRIPLMLYAGLHFMCRYIYLLTCYNEQRNYAVCHRVHNQLNHKQHRLGDWGESTPYGGLVKWIKTNGRFSLRMLNGESKLSGLLCQDI